MPLPSPNSGESREDWMGRCMGDEGMMGEFDTQDQRAAVCNQKWRDRQSEKSQDGQIEVKSLESFEIKDETKGEVIAVVATLGVVDRDRDVILHGALADGVKVKLSGYGHDSVLRGAPPVGKGVISVRGDKAVFQGTYFMSTDRGREAFHNAKEMGSEGEWSVGYLKNVDTLAMTSEWKAKGARRLISGLKPIEVSPVFVGAGIGTGTLAVKAAADAALAAEEAETAAEEAKAAAVRAEEEAAAARRSQEEAARLATEQAEAEKKAAAEAETKRLAHEVAVKKAGDLEFEKFQKTMRRFSA